jgi:flagellar basal-body rod protein FlgC
MMIGNEKYILATLLFAVVFFNLYYATSLAADPLMGAVDASASAMRAHSLRLKVISQNIANEESTGNNPAEKPYRRKTIIFKNKKNPKNNSQTVEVKKITHDYQTDFRKKYEPSHPAADKDGYVLYPNVNKHIEFVDAKEAQRSFDANLNVIEIAKSMMNKTLEILK